MTMITLTAESALEIIAGDRMCIDNLMSDKDIAREALAIIRAARAQEPAEQPVSQEYQDHLVNQSFDWAAMAAKHQFMEGYRIGLAEMRERCAKVMESGVLGHGECAAAIRAINFEGDTGFRPVSEMVAEHKQDPKKAAAIEKAKMRKAEQEPVAWGRIFDGDIIDCICPEEHALNEGDYTVPLYAAPVQQVDLTDDEIVDVMNKIYGDTWTEQERELARAVIAADRELNK